MNEGWSNKSPTSRKPPSRRGGTGVRRYYHHVMYPLCAVFTSAYLSLFVVVPGARVPALIMGAYMGFCAWSNRRMITSCTKSKSCGWCEPKE